jgi:hypothetical protein
MAHNQRCETDGYMFDENWKFRSYERAAGERLSLGDQEHHTYCRTNDDQECRHENLTL